ncbi:sulfatase-like hydrolase/transferase [Luteolibacter luteus]|uniref:Sulfatase-like hydrolase/transferase n=1 Tax=Luteolibacter luteus TaxID=2728835 RepID=A0A858RER6_9BACT|nr:sulfatase-like hydrolase/transferase [Luteolibacter luteus]QJE94653.1 sulfatase-like hydrolase/transferase [Luteolibacter luteus]
MTSRRLLLLVLSVFPLIAHAERKPNILLIVADDLGWGELGCQGFSKEIPTPHIDSIFANGTRFTDGYVSAPYCSPTRAGLLTGRYQERFGHEFNPGIPVVASEPTGLPLDEVTMGQRLKSAGYATGWFGKSHLGTTPSHHPLRRGFDEFYGFLAPGGHSYISPGSGTNAILRGYDVVKEPGYLTETFAAETVSFIERKKDEPWFVYLPFNAVHAPLETLAKYEDRFTSIQNPKRRKFAALLSALDDAVGEVLGKVKELGLEEDTLVYFVSDNGGPTDVTTSGNGPLKGLKAQTSEGGIRVPFAIQWKGHLPAGKVDSRPVIQLDLLPTSLAAAGVEIDPAWKLDGVNLLPYLKGEKTEEPHNVLYWRFGQQFAIRMGDWKLVKSAADGVIDRAEPGLAKTGGAKLYNLASDIGERNDLAAANPAKVEELAALWNAWNATLIAPKWTPPGFHPEGGRIKEGKAAKSTKTQGKKSKAEVASNASRVGPWKSGDVLALDDSPSIANKGFTLGAEIETGDAPTGVILAHGGHLRGYALHVTGGKLVFSFRSDGELTTVACSEALAVGTHKIEANLSPVGRLTLKLDDKEVAEGKTPELIKKRPGEGLTVGNDGSNPVGPYSAPNAFSGKVTRATITIR